MSGAAFGTTIAATSLVLGGAACAIILQQESQLTCTMAGRAPSAAFAAADALSVAGRGAGFVFLPTPFAAGELWTSPFAWPGVGQLFIQSVQFVDIPVMAAYLMLIGLLFVVINLAVDLLYFAVDPRLRAGGLSRAGGH